MSIFFRSLEKKQSTSSLAPKIERYRPGVIPGGVSESGETESLNSLGFVRPGSLQENKDIDDAVLQETKIDSNIFITERDHLKHRHIYPDRNRIRPKPVATLLKQPVQNSVVRDESKGEERFRLKEEALKKLFNSFQSSVVVSGDLLDEDEETVFRKEEGSLEALGPTLFKTKSVVEDKPLLSKSFIRPVFIPKGSRNSSSSSVLMNRQHTVEDIEAYMTKQKELDALVRREGSREALVQVLETERLQGKESDSEECNIDDMDCPEDQEKEYELWQLREFDRIRQELEKKALETEEKMEILRVRSMSDEEREVYLSRTSSIESKAAYKFLQKYYHKGAFYMDCEDPIFQRDYNQPTLEDQVDKSLLPEVLQVKNFGKRSRSKWRHLTAEDTTSFDGGWYQKEDAFAESMSKKLAGVHSNGGFGMKKKRQI